MARINQVLGNLTVLKRMVKQLHYDEMASYENKQEKLVEINNVLLILQKDIADFTRNKR